MHARATAGLVLATLLALGACSPTQPAPVLVDGDASPGSSIASKPSAPLPGSPPPGAAAARTFEPGPTALEVTGTLFQPCIPPPSGCAYEMTLEGPGGASADATLDFTPDYASQSEGRRTAMRQGSGLPDTLAAGDYTISFRSLLFADDATPVPGPSGEPAYPPAVAEGCRRTITVRPGDVTVRVRVTWRWATCALKVDAT